MEREQTKVIEQYLRNKWIFNGWPINADGDNTELNYQVKYGQNS